MTETITSMSSMPKEARKRSSSTATSSEKAAIAQLVSLDLSSGLWVGVGGAGMARGA